MLTEERFGEIMRIMKEKNVISVQELTELLGVSESTVRRDLTVMSKRGLLKKVYGGATTNDTSFVVKNTTVDVRESQHRDDKLRIGRYAAGMITKEDFVFIDTGTTADALIDQLHIKDCRFVTNNVGSAQKLAMAGNDVVLLGGRLNAVTKATMGLEALQGLEKYNFTKGFFGVNGIHCKVGYSTPDVDDAAVKQEAMKRCSECYILAAPSKFGRISSVTYGSLENATIITTEVKEKLWKAYTTVIEVDRLEEEEEE